MIEIIPTVVPKSFDDVIAAKNRYAGFAPSLHVDITDGRFTPEKTWTPLPGDKLPEATTTLYEVHLMVENPLQTGLMLARAGATRIIGHIEAFNNAECAREAFNMWHTAGAQESGIAVKLDTPLEELMLYMQLCDFVHMMTIEKIGKQGASFDEKSLDRIARLHARYPKAVISVDGGTNEKNIAQLSKAGASRFCVGSSLAKAKDPAATYSRLLNAVS